MDRMKAEDVVVNVLIDNPSWLDGEDLKRLIHAADTLRMECARMVDENAAVREQISQLVDRVRKYEETPIQNGYQPQGDMPADPQPPRGRMAIKPPVQIQPDDVVQEFGKG